MFVPPGSELLQGRLVPPLLGKFFSNSSAFCDKQLQFRASTSNSAVCDQLVSQIIGMHSVDRVDGPGSKTKV